MHTKIDTLIQNLDITPQMYAQAKRQYEEIAGFFLENGIHADFYPQGSFGLGTVVRPYDRGVEKLYDLDIIGELALNKDCPQLTPKFLKTEFGRLLSNHPRYSACLKEECDRCWTLSFGEKGFELDIVPSVHETDAYVESLIRSGVPAIFARNAIAITHKASDYTYDWCESNPRGYALWFDEINAPYLAISRENHRKRVLAESEGLFSSIEEIPVLLDRSALQRVIQILKRHRDVYFSNASKADNTAWDYRPSSIIITTLCAQIASQYVPTGDIFELLQMVVQELRAHSKLKDCEESISFEFERRRAYIRKSSGKWSIKNPVNPDDDFTDYWTAKHADYFFRWIEAAISDLFVQHNLNEEIQFAALKRAFGKEYVESVYPNSIRKNIPRIETGTQPYLGGNNANQHRRPTN